MKFPTQASFARKLGLIVAILVAAQSAIQHHSPTYAQGSEEIPFYKHTIDLGQSEAAEVADVNQDGRFTVADVQQVVNQALGKSQASNDLNNDQVVNVVDIQIVINAVLTLVCTV